MPKRCRSASPTDYGVYPSRASLSAGFVRGMYELQKTGSFCDVVLKGSEESSVGIPCHRSVLTVHSEYFRAAFSQDWKESTQQVYRLRNIDSQTLNELVEFVYTLDIRLNGDNVERILIAAQFLQMVAVVRMSWDYVEKHLHLSNCLLVHALASNYHNPNVCDAALSFIRRYFLEFVEGHDFLQMDTQQLMQVIGSDVLDVASEDLVFQAVMRWWEYDRPGRLAHLHTLLQTVRVPFLSVQCQQDYALALTSTSMAVPQSSAEAVGESPGEETKDTIPRQSYMILCVGGRGKDSQRSVAARVDVFSPSIPAVWRLKKLREEVGNAVVMPDSSSLFMFIAGHVMTVQRNSHYTDLRKEWRRLTSMRIWRYSVAYATLNGGIYAVGGYAQDSASMQPLTSVEVYDPNDDSWSVVASLPARRASLALVACEDRLYAFGGENGARDCRTAFCYDPSTNSWSRLANMPTARSECAACVAPSGLIYVVGDLVEPRHSPGCACVDGKLYVLGGYDANEWNSHSSIEVYDEDADRWALHACRLPQPRYGFGCVVMKMKRD
ncbi:kelch-like protein 3 [Paramacrobiotus metropolitanus]|uniref:kelch-like protein 3 n=1 Tax=Paramacrobiotus metropolitanus TaxID=2943436 RepID=UPI002445DA1C|nr:kelch-like protein 3 [Paramacrobiotus metropolitanus]